MLEDDFPDGYVDGAHPDDLTPTEHPVEPWCVVHRTGTGNDRLWWRVSWEIPRRSGGGYVSLSFLVDTGCPLPMTLSVRTVTALRTAGILRRNAGLGDRCVTLWGRSFLFARTPSAHEPANVLGLPLAMFLGLCCDHRTETFCFVRMSTTPTLREYEDDVDG